MWQIVLTRVTQKLSHILGMHYRNYANSGEHYDLSHKLTGPVRSLFVRNALQRLYSVNVNFWDSHENYYITYKHIFMSDKSVLHSNKHPDL